MLKKEGLLKNLLRDFLPCLGVIDFSSVNCDLFWLGEFVLETDGDVYRDLRLRKLFFLKKIKSIFEKLALNDGKRAIGFTLFCYFQEENHPLEDPPQSCWICP